jgi:CBS-domain-containing membrane protein
MNSRLEELPRRLVVGDVMSSPAITVPLDAGFKEIAEKLQAHSIGGMPVLDADERVAGVVSEGDLLPKEGDREGAVAPWWQPAARSEELRKAHARTARELMSAPAVTVTPRRPLAEAARLMERHHVKRLAVVSGTGDLLGVVARRDLLRAFCRPDSDIRRDVIDGVIAGWLWMDPAPLHVQVSHGVVILRGELERRSDVEMLRHLVEGLDGVVAVDSQLRYRRDDEHISPVAEAHFE